MADYIFLDRQRPVMEIFVSVGSSSSREGGVEGWLFCLGKISTFNNPPGPPLPCNLHSHCLVFNLPHRLLQQLTGRSKIFGINFPIFHSILTVIDATVWEIAVHISACFLLRRKWGKLGRGGEVAIKMEQTSFEFFILREREREAGPDTLTETGQMSVSSHHNRCQSVPAQAQLWPESQLNI